MKKTILYIIYTIITKGRGRNVVRIRREEGPEALHGRSSFVTSVLWVLVLSIVPICWSCGDDGGCPLADAGADGGLDAGSDSGGSADEKAPVLEEIEPVPTYTSNVTPLYRFFSSGPGQVLYRGPCSGDLERAEIGDNGVHLGPLTDGEYRNCALAVKDDAGNQSQWLVIQSFVVDTHAPEPPEVLTTIQRTGEERPTVHIQGEAGTDIVVDDSVLGNVGADGVGSVQLGPLADGGYTVVFQLRDAAGNVSKPTEWGFVKYSHLAACEQDGLHQTIRSTWESLVSYFRDSLSSSGTSPYVLYNVQILTAPFLRYALRHGDAASLDELASVYNVAAETLTWTDQYIFYYFPEPSSPRTSTHTLDRAYPMWLDPNSDAESILVSAQFLYAVSLLLRYAAGLNPGARSAALQDLVDRFISVLSDHYRRWVLGVTVDGSIADRGPFQVRGWGCTYNGSYVETGMSQARLTELRLPWALGDDSSPKYCNAVTDIDLWIYAGLANFLGALDADPNLDSLDPSELDQYRLALQMASVLMASRVIYRPCQDFDGNAVECAGFDEGLWDEHPDYAYSGYQGDTFPDSSQQARGSAVGWDVSHARRFVEVFETLHELAPALGLSFPNDRFMAGLARNVAHIIFLGDERLPLFTNLWDGTNGWYRVGYSGRTGFGYAPSDLSIALLNGGYALWVEYYLPLKRVYEATYAMVSSLDPEVQAFWEEHYGTCYYLDYERRTCVDLSDPANRTTQLFLLQYLSSICF